MTIVPIRLAGRDVAPHKAIAEPSFGVRTVLTNTPWAFVGLWLKRHKNERALFYWDQAQHFQTASVGLPRQSAPLLLYYSFLNAAKALLSAKGISFQEGHGVKAHNLRRPGSKTLLGNEGLKILNAGVVPTLATYFGDLATARVY